MRSSFLVSLAAVKLALGDSNPPSCGTGLDACPKEYPCCSADGTCGNGYVCLGGCDPRFSYEPGACVAMPVCQNTTYNFTGTDGIASYSDYLGNATKAEWSYLGNITEVDGKLRTQLFKSTTGTTISSSRYIWYGRVDIVMKTSHDAGVVSDFILLSNVKDEIDYEFIGSDLTEAQTNYYWHGALDYTKEVSESVSDTYANYHTYSIDWTPDQIEWIIDGNSVRTLQKSDTYNSTSKTYSFPQTPARVQFGLWPGGDSSAQGTSEWAGGSINWDASDITGSPGYFFVEVDSISISCYDPPSGTQENGTSAYVYTSAEGLASSIALTDDDTVLGATDGTGLQLEGQYGSSSSSKSASSSGAAVTLSGASSASKSTESSSGAAVTLSGASVSSSTQSSSSEATSSSSQSSETQSSQSASASSSEDTESSSSSAAESQSTQASSSAAASASSSGASSGSSASAASSSATSSAASSNDAASLLAPALALLPVVALL